MSEAECLAIMKEELYDQINMYCFLMLLACVSSVPQLIQRIRKGYRWTPLQEKRFWLGVFVFMISIYMMFSRTAELRKDINNKQIITGYGSYYFAPKHTHKTRKPYIDISIGEDFFHLFLPQGWTKKEFPFGSFTGQIYYAKESKLVLGFIPDE